MSLILRCLYLRWFFCACGCLAIVWSDAQVPVDGIPYIRNYTRQDYNASPFNWSVVQDTRGIIYVANNYNLLEFDGNNWRNMPLPNRTVIRSLVIDPAGTVYVGGQADFGYLVPGVNGESTFVSLKPRIDSLHRTFADVWKILVTEKGVAFCTSAGIYYLTNDRIRFYRIDQPDPGLISFFYVSQRFFVSIEKVGILELKNHEFTIIPHTEALAGKVIVGMNQAPGNKILLVTQQSGAFIYDGYGTFEEWNFEGKDFLRKNIIVCTASLKSGYAFGSSHNGLMITSSTGQVLMHLNKSKGLQNNGIEYIYPDNNGNLWLALRDGIDYIEINSPFTIYNSRVGISGSGFTSRLEDDYLYLGTSEGLYCKKRGQNEFRLIEGSQGQTYNLQKLGELLLLTHNNGAFQVSGETLTRLGNQTGAWLFFEPKGHPGYLVCGSYSGLFLYRVEGGTLRFLWKITGFDQSSRVIEQDEDGTIWIAHGYLGLYKLRLADDLRKVEKIDFYDSRHGFPSNVFINVFKINNELVFAGERGIYSYNREQDRFSEHPLFNNLISRTSHTRKLIEDVEGNVWFSAGDELGVLKRLNSQNYEVTRTIFNKLQRKLVGGFEHIAYYGDQVIIGTEDGFVRFDPSFIFNPDHTFSTLIRKVEITGEKDSLLAGGSILHGMTPELPFDQNRLRFTFSATSYEDAPKVQYQYMLEGYEEVWAPWTRFTSKEYTNLREGTYTFKVRSKDIYNREGSVAAFQVKIRPPWFRTIWAYLIYVALSATGLYFIISFATSHQKKMIRLKEVQHHEEVLEAEKEIIRLNNDKLESEIAHKNKELASSAMHVVHNVETIQKIKNALIKAIESVQDEDAKSHIRKVLRMVANEINIENNWDQFETHFNQIHQDFLVRLRKEYPNLTHNDIKLISYLKLNLSSKEIAPLLNLSVRGVEASRYRIRKKMNLSNSVNLTEFILKY